MRWRIDCYWLTPLCFRGPAKHLTQGFGISDPQRSVFEITISFCRFTTALSSSETCRIEDIPDTTQEKPQPGKVIAIGPGGPRRDRQAHPIDVRVGDRIPFGKWSGTEVKIDGVEYLIMKESDIMRVLVEVEAKKKAA